MKITRVSTWDLRYPTSLTGYGQDRVHKKPDYSAAFVRLHTDTGHVGLGQVFTIGGRNASICQNMKELAEATLIGVDIDEFREDRGKFWHKFAEHPRLRWLGQQGQYRMEGGAIISALWDLDAKGKEQPMCDLFASLSPNEIANCIPWKLIEDELPRERGLALLKDAFSQRVEMRDGILVYQTQGWSGMSDDILRDGLTKAKAAGVNGAKMKVADKWEDDPRIYTIIREIMGPEALIMTDANQFFSAPKAIEYIKKLHEHGLLFYWLEEMCHNDDIRAHLRLLEVLKELYPDVEKRPLIVGGEHCGNLVIAKQFLYSGAYQAFQMDACRVAGPNENFAIMLMAMDAGVPLCPHAGGIGLCQMVPHYSFFDQEQIAPWELFKTNAAHSRSGVPESKLTRRTEFLSWLLDDTFIHPVRVANGHYVRPTTHGWGLEPRPYFVRRYRYDGKAADNYWTAANKAKHSHIG